MDKIIEEVLSRGIANIIPDKIQLSKLLHSGKKLNIYLGIDPTSTKIHLGHAVSLRKLQEFAKLGHNVKFLIGDFTALIGDTSDKESERPILTAEQIEENFKYYKSQAEKIVDFSNITVVHNSEWLRKLTFSDIISLTQQFSLNDFIGRELIRKRLLDGKHVRLDEAIYPLMQGYDSYTMDTDIQIGGTDQTFNMQAGRTLQKNLRQKESFVITTDFLLGTDGRKMSKSWGNAIWLDDTPEDMFAKVMAINDDLIISYYTLATNVPLEEVNEARLALKKQENPMVIKKDLAFEIVEELCGLEQAEYAKQQFEKIVQRKEVPAEVTQITDVNITFGEHIKVSDLLTQSGIMTSRGEVKRLIEQRGIKINDQVLTLDEITINNLPITVQIGKRKFYNINKE